jgi:hypothetical protein
MRSGKSFKRREEERMKRAQVAEAASEKRRIGKKRRQHQRNRRSDSAHIASIVIHRIAEWSTMIPNIQLNAALGYFLQKRKRDS